MKETECLEAKSWGTWAAYEETLDPKGTKLKQLLSLKTIVFGDKTDVHIRSMLKNLYPETFFYLHQI